jgi:putative acetyltransferase
MTTIRAEGAQDASGIRTVNEKAFGQPTEADLVDELRRTCGECLSLVAERGGIVGHILFTPATVDSGGRRVTGMGLAPMASRPNTSGRA